VVSTATDVDGSVVPTDWVVPTASVVSGASLFSGGGELSTGSVVSGVVDAGGSITWGAWTTRVMVLTNGSGSPASCVEPVSSYSPGGGGAMMKLYLGDRLRHARLHAEDVVLREREREQRGTRPICL